MRRTPQALDLDMGPFTSLVPGKDKVGKEEAEEFFKSGDKMRTLNLHNLGTVIFEDRDIHEFDRLKVAFIAMNGLLASTGAEVYRLTVFKRGLARKATDWMLDKYSPLKVETDLIVIPPNSDQAT